MKNKLKSVIIQMLIQIFRPLVKILLRLKVPFNEVSDILRWTYVDVANEHFGINGKPPSKSRISVITGLSRTQVDIQMKSDLFTEETEQYKWNRAVRVLTGWAEDKDYLDQHDKAKILPLDSKKEPDFKSLVEKYSGGATVRSILDDLVVSGSAKVVDGDVELLKPYYLTVNDPDDVQKLNFLGVSTQYLLETIEHNINPEKSDPRFQRIVFHEELPISLINIAESFVRDKSQQLANEVDEYLEHLIQYANDDGETLPYIGLGLYYYQGDKQ
ncbi:DUF6502 family protein [Marinicella sp. S1101]|uniref:DUF6502 family protein n=1 Tax=Marinicella marina TaxID=2996016 RepID=UPI002260CEEC|nr:DUF6502 family protein [Marinicella marina]MCX7553400.1 DUF6502 family protein [Marinicella marina]MDJ1140023.1 DUF6502 family protein [Marinicella marina]